MIKKAKITAAYPKGVYNLRVLGRWQINERRYFLKVIPYWKVIEEIDQVEPEIDSDMNFMEVLNRVRELGYELA